MSRLLTDAPRRRAAWATKARAVRIEEELARRGYPFWTKPRNNNLGQPCPMCGGRDRFSAGTKKQIFFCRGCKKSGDIIALVQALDDCEYLDAIAYLTGSAPSSRDYSIRKQPASVSKQREELSNNTQNLAMGLWRASTGPRGTLAEAYLRSRGLELPDEAGNEAIRFHPDCPFGQERFPAMICLVRNITANNPQAIHRTALGKGGTAIKSGGKTYRLSLGPTKDGAVKIDPDEDVTKDFASAKGSKRASLGGRWVTARHGRLGLPASQTSPVLPGIGGLTIFGERDEKQQNMKAIESCAGHWLGAGIETLATWSMGGNDLNDEIEAAP